MGDSKTLIVSAKGDGSLVFYTGMNTNENWAKEPGIDFSNKARVLDWFRTEFSGLANVYSEVFENADPSFAVRPQYCMPFEQTWPSLANLTMLGDAAHLMPPYAGEGVNMAMLDAVELCSCLIDPNSPDLKSAIEAYEHEMRNRASEVAQETMRNTAAMHSENAIEFFVSAIS